jgi:SAM-dependent methyltransferase
VTDQIAGGRLVCPVTHQPLVAAGQGLRTADGTRRYPVVAGVPVLLADPERWRGRLATREGAAMEAEYRGRGGGLARLVRRLGAGAPDHRSEASLAAFAAVVGDAPRGALCLAVGGGPRRVHPALVNLNLDVFPGVDVVGDAHRLPYAGDAVDAVHCEAVLEHLERPAAAVAEMHRVLRVGGEVFAATPFLQAFHGYPGHFQNFTRAGHQRLFEEAGFEVVASGVCVGPTFALLDLVANYLRLALGGGRAVRAAARLVELGGRPLRRLDRRLNRLPGAERFASTTFVHARKPG